MLWCLPALLSFWGLHAIPSTHHLLRTIWQFSLCTCETPGCCAHSGTRCGGPCASERIPGTGFAASQDNCVSSLEDLPDSKSGHTHAHCHQQYVSQVLHHACSAIPLGVASAWFCFSFSCQVVKRGSSLLQTGHLSSLDLLSAFTYFKKICF